MDSSVIDAIRTAVEGSPENVELRLHLASLLASAGRDAEALEQAGLVLARQPSHLGALRVAAEAAERAGETARAAGYRQLLDALGWTRTKDLLGDSAPLDEAAPSIAGSIDPRVGDGPPRRQGRERVAESFSDSDDAGLMDRWQSERPEISLADVAGMEIVKQRLNTSFLGPMRNPDLRKLYGKSLRGGLLLYGPPGCGKTYLARAVAGELGARFLSVGLTDVMDMWLGNSEKQLHELFQTARRLRPCVLFMDELDALGRKRSLMRHLAGANTINQLLAELDGVEHDNEGVFFLAATNHPWDVDSALRRPGRLDRMLLVLPPDLPARQAIIEAAMRERPTDRLDARWLAEKTDEFSGADVVHLCDSAAEFALEDSIKTGSPRPISMNDFKRALRDIRQSTRPWLETAKNHAIYANEGGIYDDLLAHLKQRRML